MLKSPFPYFGGKSTIAHEVWQRFGDVPNYVEPFCGSAAILLARPTAPHNETINDIDCMIANFWRATRENPAAVAHHADWPVNEADLHARHTWLIDQEKFRQQMKTDPHYYDPKIAGWWVWGQSMWIGDGWCRRDDKQRPDIKPQGVHAKRPRIWRSDGGVHKQKPDLYGNKGIAKYNPDTNPLEDHIQRLSDRLRRVRVLCGHYDRVLGPSVTYYIGLTAVFLDPPYSHPARDKNLYNHDDTQIAQAVAQWAKENGDNPKLRIALCGYEGEHTMPTNWECLPWKAPGGYANRQNSGRAKNRFQERIWFSPHCLKHDLLNYTETDL